MQLGATATGSRFAALNDHQGDDAARGNCAWGLRRLPHGHSAHAGVHDEPQGGQVSMVCSAILSALPLLPVVNWRGLRSASFSRIKIGGILPRRNSRVRAVTGCASHFHSANPAGANRLCVRNTLPNQHVLQTVADRFHVTRRLSRASLRPTHIGRSEKEWRYLISVMRCPK